VVVEPVELLDDRLADRGRRPAAREVRVGQRTVAAEDELVDARGDGAE
jgi:hypothetical protein